MHECQAMNVMILVKPSSCPSWQFCQPACLQSPGQLAMQGMQKCPVTLQVDEMVHVHRPPARGLAAMEVTQQAQAAELASSVECPTATSQNATSGLIQ